MWALLFVNVLGFSGTSVLLPVPHKVGQLLTQGALPAALIVAFTVNPKGIVRPNWFLGLYSALGTITLMMSVRLVGVGTTYRGLRLVMFLAVLWLLTPWWRDRGLALLRSQLLVLSVILATVVLGCIVAPGKAFSLNYRSARLTGVVWPIPATAVAHYMAELAGLTILLWLCGMISRRPALVVVGTSLLAVVATRTRTALAGLVLGLLVAGLSLFLSQRRVRRAFTICLVVIVTVVVPLSPRITSWLERGQSTTDIRTLSGRTKVWPLVLSESRPETNKILGSGLSNDSVINQAPGLNGLPIDSSWLATYQNQGVVGWVVEAIMFLGLLLTAALQPRGPTRALALFLIVYCLFSSYTDTGMGEASIYLLDLTLAASLLVARASDPRNEVFELG
ncbi:MAG TPA: O-antigen ligase family protein [Acidimicrobiales bacterium]|nr:O-antigen ligase family protein [Acidimicrobiales bacterium]